MKTFHLTVCCPDDRVNGTYEIWVFSLKDSKRNEIHFVQCKANGFIDALRLARTRLMDALEYD